MGCDSIIASHSPYTLSHMAKPIELGLVLEGEDALAFHRYLHNPTDTPEGRKLLLEAYEEAENSCLK